MAQNILVATDGSETANHAIDTAARLAVALGLDLHVVHVLMHGRPNEEWMRMAETENLIELIGPVGGYEATPGRTTVGDIAGDADDDIVRSRAVNAYGEEILARARARAEEAGVKTVATMICAGDYADEILDLADADRPEMIVIGSRGLGRVRGALLGSVSQKVLHHAPCTVVVVR